jgi:hypothetical protein
MKINFSFVPSIALMLLVLWRLIDVSLIYSSATIEPEPATAHVEKIFVHGRNLFITAQQIERLAMLHWSNILIGILLVIVIFQRILKAN